MNISGATFTKNDVQFMEILEKLLTEKASFSLSAKESVQLAHTLNWLASLKKTIEGHIFDGAKVIEPAKEEAPKKKSKAKKV